MVFLATLTLAVNGNREILKCMLTLNGTYLRTKIIIYFNILLYIAILYYFHPRKFVKKCTH